jgi:hypothetical protein
MPILVAGSIQPRVPRLPHFTHPTRSDGLYDLVGAEFMSNAERPKVILPS